MSGGDEPRLVVDNGTFMMKGGYAGDDCPRVDFPTFIGRPENETPKHDIPHTNMGMFAWEKRSRLDLNNPMSRGSVVDWGDMERIWHHMFYMLYLQVENFPVLLTEIPNDSKANREKTVEIMFEKFRVPVN
jgi:actin-related protein